MSSNEIFLFDEIRSKQFWAFFQCIKIPSLQGMSQLEFPFTCNEITVTSVFVTPRFKFHYPTKLFLQF